MPTTPGGEAVDLLISEAQAAYHEGRIAQSLRAAERAVRAAEALDDPSLLVRALSQEQWALTYQGDYAGAMVRCTRVLAMSQDPAISGRLGDHRSAVAIGDAYIDFVEAARLRGTVSPAELFTVLDAADRWMTATGHRNWRAGVLYQRAHLHSFLGHTDKAIDLAQEALGAHSAGGAGYSLAAHRNTLGRFLAEAGRFDEARPCFEAILDASGSSPHLRVAALRNLAEGCAKTGERDQAHAFADEAIELARSLDERTTARALASRGLVHRRSEEYTKALEDYDRAIALCPDADGLFAGRGECYRLMKRYDEALADFDRAIELDPADCWSIASRGQVHRQTKRYEEALTGLDHALRLGYARGWIYAERGETHRLMSRYDEALADFDRAIELDPADSWSIASRAQVHRQTKRYEEALTGFDHALRLGYTRAWIYAERGETHRVTNHYDQALADFDRAIELDPADSWSIASRGQVHRALGNLDRALEDFGRAISLTGDRAWMFTERGEVHESLGRDEEALPDFERAVELDPANTWAAGRCDKVRERLRRSVGR